MIYCSEIHIFRDLAGKESMAEGEDLIDEAFFMCQRRNIQMEPVQLGRE